MSESTEIGDIDREEAVVFGRYDNLVGVVRNPIRPKGPEDLAVLILTPGMLHSAGPFRLHFDVSQALGESGLRSLRFDLSGIGESLAIGASGSSLQRASTEVGEAIDFLERRYQTRRVLLLGLCSGADDALYAAQQDSRVVGLFAIDGCGYRNARFYGHRLVSHYGPKLLSVQKWIQLAQRVLRFKNPTPSSLQLGSDIREFPSRAEAERQIAALAARHVQLHFHYTGGVSDYYNYKGQFADTFPDLVDLEHVTSSYHPESDHVAFLCEHREALVQLVCEGLYRMAQRLPEPQPSENFVRDTAGQENPGPATPLFPSNACSPALSACPGLASHLP